MIILILEQIVTTRGFIGIFQKTKAIKIAISKSILIFGDFGDKDRILIIIPMSSFALGQQTCYAHYRCWGSLAYKIAKLPLFSGALFRTTIIFLIIGIHHVLKYDKTIYLKKIILK